MWVSFKILKKTWDCENHSHLFFSRIVQVCGIYTTINVITLEGGSNYPQAEVISCISIASMIFACTQTFYITSTILHRLKYNTQNVNILSTFIVRAFLSISPWGFCKKGKITALLKSEAFFPIYLERPIVSDIMFLINLLLLYLVVSLESTSQLHSKCVGWCPLLRPMSPALLQPSYKT